MELLFLRHGEAEAGGARPLTPKGRAETRRVCARLAELGLEVRTIYTSPLLRAKQTAEVAGKALGREPQVSDLLDSGATLAKVEELVPRGLGPRTRVMLVGHEPDFSTIIGLLIGGGAVEMKKSGLARVECDKVEPGRGVLKWLITAELVG